MFSVRQALIKEPLINSSMSRVAARFCCLAILFVAGVGHAAEPPPLQSSLVAVKPRQAAPGMVLKDVNGNTVSLARLRGKVVVVNFWATWCPPCRREFPSMERLRLAFDKKPLVILAVNEGESAEIIEGFTSQLDLSPNFPVLLDPEGAAMAFWSVRGLPTTYVVDKRGRIAFRAIGGREFDHPEIIQTINTLLRER